MARKALNEMNFKGKTVLMRVDFNVPLKDGVIGDDGRIQAALPSIKRVLEDDARLVLMTHLGRPKGAFAEEFSLKPVARALSELLSRPVTLGPSDVVGEDTSALVGKMNPGDVVLLENLRFHAGETLPDKAKKNPDGKLTPEQGAQHQEFVEALASLGDAYVNDAFGTCHRKHASMYGVAKALKERGEPVVAGFLVEKEIRYLHEAVADPKRPFIAILGGAKVSDKIKLIETLLDKVDGIIIGGAMAYTLLKAKGTEVGKSLVEEDQVETMKGLLDRAKGKIHLPVDHIATDDFAAGAPVVVNEQSIPENLMGMDIGAHTVEQFEELISHAGTVVWNGPMGVFERNEYANGTLAVATALANATDKGAVTVIGGGDSASAVKKMGLDQRMTHVSTGGGASLTYLEGKPMPAIDVLNTED